MASSGCERLDAPQIQLRWALRRMNTLLPGGFPQTISLVPLRKLLLLTVRADQLVVLRLVENCGKTVQLLVRWI